MHIFIHRRCQGGEVSAGAPQDEKKNVGPNLGAKVFRAPTPPRARECTPERAKTDIFIAVLNLGDLGVGTLYNEYDDD